MYSIGEFANKIGVTQKTLRHYEKLELIKPEYIDENTGYRYYSSKQEVNLNRILELKSYGFTLKEIKKYQDFSLDELKKELSIKINMINQKIYKDEQVKNKLERILSLKKSGEFKMNNMIVMSEDKNKRNKYFEMELKENMNNSLVLVNFNDDEKQQKQNILEDNGYDVKQIGNDFDLNAVIHLIYGASNVTKLVEKLQFCEKYSRRLLEMILIITLKNAKRKNIKDILLVLEENNTIELFNEWIKGLNEEMHILDIDNGEYLKVREEVKTKLEILKKECYEIPFDKIEKDGKRMYKAKIQQLFHPKMLRMKKTALYVNGEKDENLLMLYAILDNINIDGESITFIINELDIIDELESYIKQDNNKSINFYLGERKEISKDLFEINIVAN
ncbi:MAG: MerR family transcriptional regulator [Clostridia bacterium]|jgi:DNA-binding transcriptional MerR regulator|nr:MerR family transcriptional regulator [Clostridia bacterium]